VAGEKISIVIEVESSDKALRDTLSKIGKAAGEGGDKAGKSFGDGFSSHASLGMKSLVGAAVAAGTAIAGALFSKAAIQASIVQQDAIAQLNNSLSRIG
jgi:hypothetical protein